MLHIEHLTKRYNNQTILEDFTTTIEPGQLVCIFGPNGSGKSTLLQIVAGLEKADSGTILIDTTEKKPHIGFVFQNYHDSMMPWLSVTDNVALPLKAHGYSTKDSINKAKKIIRKIGLEAHKHKYLYQLSGGQRQLTAVARSFAGNPDILLMDEPCSALDYQTTKEVELKILSLWQLHKITTLIVSHDIDEAVFLADRILVLSKSPGKIIADIKVSLPRPRTLELFNQESFFKIRSQVLEAFYGN